MYKVWLPLHIWCICKSISFLVVIHIKLYFIAYIYTFYTEKILYSIAVEVKIKHFLGRDHWSKWVHLWYIQIPSVPQKSNFYNESSVGALYITYHITNYPSVDKSEIGLDLLDNIRIQKIIPDENEKEHCCWIIIYHIPYFQLPWCEKVNGRFWYFINMRIN